MNLPTIFRLALVAAFIGACAFVQSVPGAPANAWAFIFFLFPLPFVGWLVAWQAVRAAIDIGKAVVAKAKAKAPATVAQPAMPVIPGRNRATAVIITHDHAAEAEDHRLAAAAIAAETVAAVKAAGLDRPRAAKRPTTIVHGDAQGDPDAITITETVPAPGDEAARREAADLAARFAMPAARDERRRG